MTPARKEIKNQFNLEATAQEKGFESNVTPDRLNDVDPEPSECGNSPAFVVPQPPDLWKGSEVGRKSCLMRKERELQLSTFG